jgi:hypothetical protein
VPQIVYSQGELLEKVRSRSFSLIAVDGYQGAGKTTVARFLALNLSCDCVHLDEFLMPGEGFCNSLNYPKLGVATSRRPLLIEGVCLSAVMTKLGLSPDLTVYVYSPEPKCDRPRGKGRLAHEVRAYHQVYDPQSRADIVYFAPDIGKEFDGMRSDRAETDILYIKSNTIISVVLGLGGILALLVGLVVLLFRPTGNVETLIKVMGLEVSAKGLGAVIMATSILWAFFAYQSRPKYSHTREYSEKFDPDSKLLERFEQESSTMLDRREQPKS